MKNWILVFLLYLVSWQSYGNAVPLLLPSDNEIVHVPFQQINGFIVVKIKINDIFSFNFILDTGAEHTILFKKEVANLSALESKKKINIIGADMSTVMTGWISKPFPAVIEDRLRIETEIVVLDEDYFQLDGIAGIPIDGLIGSDILSRYIVHINYDRSRITFAGLDSKYDIPGDYKKVNTSFRRNKPYVNVCLSSNPGDSSEVCLLFDSGASLTQMIYTDKLHTNIRPSKYIKGVIGKGLGGNIEGFLGKVIFIKIPPYKFENIITNFMDTEEQNLVIKDSTRHGIIGSEIIKRFNIIIDYKNQELYLKPSRSFYHKYLNDRSGLSVVAVGQALNEYEIVNVIQNSPAGEAGLKKGDMIISINHRKTEYRNLQWVQNKLCDKEGKMVRFYIRRDKEKLIKNIILRDLL